MVNYCCVHGCGRNSRLNKHLNYYGLPKERDRQAEWLKAAWREDLLKKVGEKVAISYRFCSRHFPPSSIKNRHLSPDAIPTLNLPGSSSEEETKAELVVHNDIICDNCKNSIMGFRYKCINCVDYDLCQKCEMLEAHPDHYMLRMPKPLKFKLADNLVKKWRQLFNESHISPSSINNGDEEDEENCSISSDDEPITKYANSSDSGVDLTEDEKLKIRNEVNRALTFMSDDDKAKDTKSDEIINKKRIAEETDRSNKRMRNAEQPDTAQDQTFEVIPTDTQTDAPDLLFADVNDIKYEEIVDSKNELLSVASIIPDATDSSIMHVKLSDDLSQLMIEMTKDGRKLIYKYGEQ